MAPTSKVIQIVKHSNSINTPEQTTVYIALCDDGSVWIFSPNNQKKWELVVQMEGKQYPQ